MKRILQTALFAILALGLTVPAPAAEIFKNDDGSLTLGGRLKTLGEIQYLKENDELPATKTANARVYLFGLENRLFAYGEFKDFKYNFEVGFGGESVETSNNNINLKEFNADIPLIPDMAYVKVGQFKVPSNLESAVYEGNQQYTRNSPLMNMFFNTGYDNGAALWGKIGDMDFAGGAITGSPNLPQRYIPEILNFPPLVFARVGYTNGLGEDPFHQLQAQTGIPDKEMIAIHANFLGGHDSNAGHSTVFGLQNSATGKYSYNSDAGNMLLYTLWNPYLGKKKADGTVGATYWQAGLDAQFRAPVGDTALSLQAQATVAQFYAYFAPVTINGEVVGEGSINIGGGLLSAAIGHEPWQIAARFAVVVPDNAFTAGGGPITGSDPILELTLPSITFHLNENAKLVADAIWMIDTPYRVADNGTILLAEMPSQAGSTPGTNLRTDLAPVGRMMFQYTY